jgi:lipopolysaccharide transport system ATP-binding protein
MEDVADREGRTVLFVSHQMAAIQTLCSKGIFLHQGSVFCSGEIGVVISSYQDFGASSTGQTDISQLPRSGSGSARFSAVYAVNQQGIETNYVQLGNPLRFCFELYSDKPIRDLSVGFSIHDQGGQSIALAYSDYDNMTVGLIGDGQVRKVVAKIDAAPLAPGRYSVGVRMTQRGTEIDWPKGTVCSFDVIDAPYYANPGARTGQKSLLCVKPDWSIEGSMLASKT